MRTGLTTGIHDRIRKSRFTLMRRDDTMQHAYLCYHVVDEPVLIPDAQILELLPVALVVDLLKDLHEATIVGLQDGVLCGQVQGPAQKDSGS